MQITAQTIVKMRQKVGRNSEVSKNWMKLFVLVHALI